ncbi:protease inhibitors-like [Athalia rosae]|uniref:protease inhibitors-like n=1 Tax=Athalia rosae TaxID=37344 RepID=UPI0020349DA2|nr:protease inhibitors-like [Athalia rosae]
MQVCVIIVCLIAFIAIVRCEEEGDLKQSSRAVQPSVIEPCEYLLRNGRKIKTRLPGIVLKNLRKTCTSKDGIIRSCPTRLIYANLLRQQRDDNFKCVPDKNFKNNCNWCECASDGRSAVCTQMECDSNLH